MELSKEQLDSYIELCHKESGILLSPVQAQKEALSLLRLLAIATDYDSQGMDDTMD